MERVFASVCFAAVLLGSEVAMAVDPPALPESELAKVLESIRVESTRPNFGPTGRPLPLVGHWNRGSQPAGFGPDYQIGLIRAGHHLLPWFEFPQIGAGRDNRYFVQYQAAFEQTAKWKLPITLVGTQWEFILAKKRVGEATFPFRDLPADKSALALNAEGQPDPRLGISPFGAIEPWKEVGKLWTASPMMQRLQELYPQPPLVILLSNNEAGKLRWHKSEHGGGVEADKRYLDQYGPGKDDDFKRKVMGDGFIVRYKAMFDGMRDGLTAPAWKQNARFVAYNAFGPDHMGRWDGWPTYSMHCKGRFDWGPYAWDGSSPSYYTHNWDGSTDFTVHGPGISFMNYVMAQRQLFQNRPDYWFEFSVWDGSTQDKQGQENGKWAFYEKHGEKYTPPRHGSFVELGLWLMRPRLVREFRGYLDTRQRVGEYFEAIVKVVDRVHADPTLTRFWHKGELVPNRAHPHPYQAGFSEEYRNEDRWYLLDTDADPARPWKLDTEIPVQSLAYVLGARPQREWLVYARSPLKDRSGVAVTIPEYGKVTVDVPIAGAFYHIQEKEAGIRRIGPMQ